MILKGTEILAVATIADASVVGEGGEYNLEELQNIIEKGKDQAQVAREELITGSIVNLTSRL